MNLFSRLRIRPAATPSEVPELPEPSTATAAPPTGSCRRLRRRARTLLGTMALLLLTAHLLSLLAFDSLCPSWRDPEYGRKVAVIQRMQRQFPERPMIVLLGSSRVSMGLRTGVLEGDSAFSRRCVEQGIVPPAFVNASLIGSGPVMQLMMLRRLLEDGIRPAAVLAEVWSPFFGASPELQEEHRIDLLRLRPRELEWLPGYFSDPQKLADLELPMKLVPWYHQRVNLMTLMAPSMLPNLGRRDANWRLMDAYGWVPGPKAVQSPAELQKQHAIAEKFYRRILEDWQPGDRAMTAQQSIFALCQEHQIPIRLMQLPESALVHAWTSPATEQRFTAQLAIWERDYGAKCQDFRTVMPGDVVPDGIHLTPEAAAQFTGIWAERMLEILPDAVRLPRKSP
ncbi:hypothetical protein [Tuwongella immobilis]|uniref:Uncharacterized protein n=1 Tax=Tuwongella immobilis TaxID=692036 RepID=A0A6C2YXS2_9BACT|nr:hypothetical protein [Tuwongella immobilis]VIP05659.1 Uncharacterized protein OS=Singulisphaera acidiphila (strain ATCC BAA-1392 / DSM 18658 / VKM B-2454 / MOB10) GN=Sinac_5817 PE=4 SV=1 [Tuwongella immobilis]VTS08674.1 Uncharacterized protein OS=Singulisphaera acidiphila (strain ATCC BAA-1392 / DSM 18658 / VKM B-2454 / MOB10) GN=Sinac_5817 PE=4 SV=1 [Tuwongella immobilis]